MKIQLKMPIIEAVQFKKEMSTGWATRSSFESVPSHYIGGIHIDSSWKKFPFSEYPDAEEQAKALYEHKNAVPYWVFEHITIVNPQQNMYYWVEEEDGLLVDSLEGIKELYNIVEK